MSIENLLDAAQSSDEKERLLALLLEDEGFSLAQADTIAPRSGELIDPPLSFAQQRLWFLNQLQPESPFYNIPAAVRLAGKLNVSALRRALNEIVRRHEALRTSFPQSDGRPHQSIAEELELELPVLSLEEDESSEERVVELANLEAQRPFDLSRGPLIRSTLLRLSETEHVLLLTIHHIVSDGWSLGVFISELVILYEAFSAGVPSPLPEPSIQYADFAVWQRDWLQGEVRQKQLDFWKEQLSGAPAALEFPTDRRRPATQSFRGANQTLVVSKHLTESLKTLSREEGSTLFMSLLAGFTLLLSRYSGQTDVVVGTPTANRSRQEIEGLIGFFANTLALRTRVDETESFRELLNRVRETTMAAFANQDLPFEQIVEELQPERDMARSPLFQVMLALQNAPVSEMKLSGLALSPIETDSGTAMFDLLLSLAETEEGLAGKLVYSTDLFDEGTITEFLGRFGSLLEGAAKAPDAPVYTLLREIPPQKLSLVVASTFTANPLSDALGFWLEELHTPALIRFAPYGQLFQQLLDPEGLLARNKEGVNLILMRLEDWSAGERRDDASRLEQNVREFLDALRSFSEQHSTETILALCPPSEAVATDAAFASEVSRLEAMIAREAAQLTGISVLRHEEVSKLYEVAAVNDPHTDELGHIPYTQQFFTALGTTIARKIFQTSLASYEVIALDCDETLWGGVCGEDEPEEMQTGFPYRDLHERLLRERASGRLLCLCSRNSAGDVTEVFRQHSGMLLKPEHFISSRVSWNSTSENLTSLSTELNLPLERFIYLSANPVECEQVRALHPEVLVVRLPADADKMQSFLNHLWIFEQS
ncbi:MAG TPA: condensation domain-containing protein [Pyrinomonadaceae bacterium]|nr:condensation domain-containing protein [Pyrinomonadaceae bacterium]